MEKMKINEIGSVEWNDSMYNKHPTPYKGIAGKIEKYRIKKIVSIIKKYKKSEDFTLLEIGCEAGNLLKNIIQKFTKSIIIGIDISEEALMDAKKKLPDKILLQQKDIVRDDIKLPIDNLDFLVCSETLEHIPEIDKAIENLWEISNDNTLVIITVPYEKIKNLIKTIFRKIKLFNFFFKGIEENFSEWHIHDLSKKDFIDLISEKFEVLKYKKILKLHQLIIGKKKINVSN